MRKNIKVVVAGLLSMPTFVFAAEKTVTNLTSFITAIGGIIGQIVPLILAIAVLYLIWNIGHFVMSGQAGDEKARSTAMNNVIWSIIGIFIMLSVWGLVGLLQGTIGFTPPELTGVKFTPLSQ